MADELRLFTCPAYGVTLSPCSCALRHRKAHQPNPKGIPALLAAHCVGCTIGEAHADQRDAPVSYQVRSTSLRVVESTVPLPPPAPPPPTFDERIAATQARAQAKRKSEPKRPATWLPPEPPEPLAHLAERIRPILQRRPFATLSELQTELVSTNDPKWRTPVSSRIQRAVREVTGIDRRLLSLGKRQDR